ncbi:MAG TPA: glucose-methanol-choline oxidoreductase, partial [Erythrobacter sp.]|nr:glucose-methanol-choline oxidoreductase [Erythrobacter sp.]
MLSGIGPGAHIKEHGIDVVLDKPAVGADLQDHIDYVSSWQTESKDLIGDSLAGTVRMAKAIIEHRRKRTGIMTTPYAEAGGFWKVVPDAPAPDIQWHFVPAMLEDHGRTKVKGHGFSLHACVLRPESRGTVRLNGADARMAPRIDPNFLDDERDMATLRAGVRLSHRIVSSPSLAKYDPQDRYPIDLEDDAALDAMIRNRADTVYHPVGTCRMGGDSDAVVDHTLKARGIEGLYVADASVMPRLVSGNTNAPSIMIGERCADFVKDALAA